MKKFKRFLIGDKKQAVKASLFWNSAGGMLSAFQSVLFLMILSRVLGLAESGLFSIAFANANLFANIGRFGVRNFQVSDVQKEYSFSEYLTARFWTTGLMIICFSAYLIWIGVTRHYSSYKFLLIFFVCFSKIIDSIEDVFYGYLQQRGRLDIGARILTIRLSVLYISFFLVVLLLRNQMAAILISSVFSALSCWYCFYLIRRPIKLPRLRDVDWKLNRNILNLLIVCIPLFLSTFLSIYIGNAPKYAIDSSMTEEIQAIFSFISMPIFVINLLNNFIYQPFLFQLSQEWKSGRLKRFGKTILIEMAVILLISLGVILAGKLIGIWALSILYSVDLKAYELDFIILLAGGSFLAYSGFFISILTIMRKQKAIAWIYGGVSLLALVLSAPLVQSSGIRGASWLYFFLMLILAVLSGLLVLLVYYKTKTERRRKRQNKSALTKSVVRQQQN